MVKDTHKRPGVVGQKKVIKSLRTVVLPQMSGIFIANDKFVINIYDSSEVLICDMNTSFKAWFLLREYKIENPVGQHSLGYGKFRINSSYKSIISELGSEEKMETTLADIFSLLNLQKKGEFGVLLNSKANVFFVRDLGGALCQIRVMWSGLGWEIAAYDFEPEEDNYDFFVDDQVFYRSS